MKINDKALIKEFTKVCIENQTDKMDESVYVALKFSMTNGKKVFRNYRITYDVMEKYVLQFIEKKEYRTGTLPVFEINPEMVEQIKYYDEESSDYRAKYLDITQEEIKKLLDTYKEEYLNASAEQLNDNAPVMKFVLCSDEEERGEWELTSIYVYPSFQKTLAILEEKGMKVRTLAEKEHIKELKVFRLNEEAEVTYTESEKIQELRECICLEEFGYQTAFDCNSNLKTSYQILLDIVDENGQISQQSAIFIKDIPEWLEEDLKNIEIQQEVE